MSKCLLTSANDMELRVWRSGQAGEVHPIALSEAFAAVSPGARVEFNYTSENAAASPGNRGSVARVAAAIAARLWHPALGIRFYG